MWLWEELKVMAQDNSVHAGEKIDETILPFDDLAAPESRFAAEGETAVLLGSRSASSGVETFPARRVCPETGARDMEPARFGPNATLYSFSTVHVSAARETPYTLGYIDFPSGMRTLAVMKAAGSELACDTPVVLRCDDEGWWAEPAGQAGHS